MALFRNRFTGHCAAGDIFVFSMWFEATVGVVQANGYATQYVTDLWNGVGGAGGYAQYVTEDVGVDVVSTAQVDPLTGLQSVQAETDVTLPGTDTTNGAMPADVALVVSERTIFATRWGRGRFYLPQPSTFVSSTTGLMKSSVQTDVADTTAAAYGALAVNATPVLYSRTRNETNEIVSIDVGNHLDTQRRRENAVPVTRERRTL